VSAEAGEVQLSPRPQLPRRGHPLADALALTDHCVERYRHRAIGDVGAELAFARTELRALAKGGVPTLTPPSWFAGGRGATGWRAVDPSEPPALRYDEVIRELLLRPATGPFVEA
jgi:hypothetical protein